MISAGAASPSRARRLAPLLGLCSLATLGLLALLAQPSPSPPSSITATAFAAAAQTVVNFLDLEIHSVTLMEPESEWGTLAAGLTEYRLEIDLTARILPIFGGRLGLIHMTLGGAEMEMNYKGKRFGSFASDPCQLGGGGKLRTTLTGLLQVSPWEKEAFKEVAYQAVHGDEFSIELWSVINIQLRGEENGCLLGDGYCSTTGSFTIPGVKFAHTLPLKGARSFGISLANMELTDLPSDKLAGAALITIDAVIENNSSFQMLNLDEVHLDIFTDMYTPNITDALGYRIAQVNTEHGFSLMKGINPPVQISGQLVIPNREQELAAAARVFNSFLLGKPTPLIAQVAHSSQPFYTVAAAGLPIRALLPGIGNSLRVGNTNETTGLGEIIEVVHIDFNIPVALATLANPLSGFELNQFVQLELKNPVGCTVKVTGLTVELHYDGFEIGGVDLPRLTEEQSIIIPPHAHIRTSVWLPVTVDVSPPNIIPVTKLLHEMAREEAYSKGLGPEAPPARVHVNATIKVMVGGVTPIIQYSQANMPAII